MLPFCVIWNRRKWEASNRREWFCVHQSNATIEFSSFALFQRKKIKFFSEDHTIVEPLVVPDGCKPGDRIFVEGNQGTPDDQLNPKKKVCVLRLRRKCPFAVQRISICRCGRNCRPTLKRMTTVKRRGMDAFCWRPAKRNWRANCRIVPSNRCCAMLCYAVLRHNAIIYFHRSQMSDSFADLFVCSLNQSLLSFNWLIK